MNDDDFMRQVMQGHPDFNYQIFTANDEHVCDECRAASKVVHAEKPGTPVAACQSEEGCRCSAVRTNRPVGPVKPFSVTSGAHRKGKKQEFRCKLEADTPSPIERLLGKFRERKSDE